MLQVLRKPELINNNKRKSPKSVISEDSFLVHVLRTPESGVVRSAACFAREGNVCVHLIGQGCMESWCEELTGFGLLPAAAEFCARSNNVFPCHMLGLGTLGLNGMVLCNCCREKGKDLLTDSI